MSYDHADGTAMRGDHVLGALWWAAGCSGRQFAVSAALVAAFALLALQQRAYTLLALFGALLLAVGLTSAALLMLLKRWPALRDWRFLWPALLALVALSSLAGAGLYHGGLAALGVETRNDTLVLQLAAGLALLLLAPPLWLAQHQSRALRLAHLTQSALTADLKALQAQIEPHFLYNTLANARYLAHHEPARAVSMLDHLIAYLHNALPDLRSPMSNLGREFQLAEHYLALMAIRFGDRLQFDIDCPDDLLAAALPPLMLMPLVENAIQHGVEPQAGQVTVRMRARRQQGSLVLSVRDNGAGPGNSLFGTGVGLRNLRQRLAAMHGAAAAFELRVASDGWPEAEIILPLEAA